jgi:hypothetical protein
MDYGNYSIEYSGEIKNSGYLEILKKILIKNKVFLVEKILTKKNQEKFEEKIEKISENKVEKNSTNFPSQLPRNPTIQIR